LRINENLVPQQFIVDSRSAPMPTECSPDFFAFEPVEGRAVVAAFDAGAVMSDAGALLLGATDRTIRMMDRLASCFDDPMLSRPEAPPPPEPK
jgi:hypothetical protein